MRQRVKELVAGRTAEPLSPSFVARIFAVLCTLSGLLIVAAHALFPILLPGAPVGAHAGVVAVGIVAASVGVVVWFLPWERWGRSASLTLITVFFGIVAVQNLLRANEPHAYGLLFVVAFAWLGIAHPRGTSLRLSPLFALSYLAPLFQSGEPAPAVAFHFLYTAAVCLIVGETLAWVAQELRDTQKAVTRVQEALRTREARFRSLVQNSSDVVTVVGTDGVIRYQSVSLERVFGFQANDLVGSKLSDWVHPNDSERVLAFLDEVLRLPRRTASLECRLRNRDDTWRHCETTGVNLLNDENVAGIVLNTRDVSERKALEEELSHQAFHDALTGLANRVLFGKRVEGGLARAQLYGGSLAVLFLDLDGFKTVNDSLGHEAGDQLLIVAAKRIQACLRSDATAARLGGDEFAVLLEDLIIPSDASRVADRLLETLRSPFTVSGQEVVIRASVGIAISEGGGERADELQRNADVAMYVAKGNGKDHYVVFQPRMHAAVLERLELEADLRRAVERGEFLLHYQPVVDLRDGRILALEALVRWQHPRRGVVPPAGFVALAEETGLILPLGSWVLRETCMQLRDWLGRYPQHAGLAVSVNLSAKQLQQPGFVEEVTTVLREAGVAPSDLTLEITESVLMHDTEAAIVKLEQLKELGVRLAIDDFGTGYSSLSYIRRFHIDLLKMDKSFLDAGAEPGDPSLARAIINLGHSLGLQTIAEGIETEAQVTQLVALGCAMGQGYFYNPPLSAADVEAVLTGVAKSGEWPGLRESPYSAVA